MRCADPGRRDSDVDFQPPTASGLAVRHRNPASAGLSFLFALELSRLCLLAVPLLHDGERPLWSFRPLETANLKG
jgi:hypothetical protein